MNKKDKLSLIAKSKNIRKVRNNIDAIDLKILKLLSLRRKQVIKITKFKKRSEIVDKKRINLMLKNLVQKGKKLKIESFIVVNLWKAMINSFIKLERRKI